MHSSQISDEIIVLIHGLMRTHRSMYRLELCLNRKGYETYNYSYPSTKFGINEHSSHLQNFIESLLLANPNKKLNFITHSLGGIIAREALSNISPQKLSQCSSLIMLAPPNQGSSFAKMCLTIAPFLSSFIKPLAQLSCNRDAYIHQVLIPECIKIGIIAGKFDMKAPPSTTQLNGQKEFIIINSAHTFIMNKSKSKKAIYNFLQKGTFE